MLILVGLLARLMQRPEQLAGLQLETENLTVARLESLMAVLLMAQLSIQEQVVLKAKLTLLVELLVVFRFTAVIYMAVAKLEAEQYLAE